ncbi:sulfotransferase [Stenotrophomonas sp. PS02297]|uniref:sulfotransferase family protein n=1 Tax=Stenotrophomonas sp. PS02297 TaxID=2991423 RepID=UPI00249A1275|nr:sulfotransferase [Stenotrophomonas sp. PS02297]
MIGGVQKGGTTALAHFLARHRGVALPRGKEAHVFDAPDFDEAWTQEYIDGLYDGHFDAGGADVAYGDATPIYCFHHAFIDRIAAYNPEMRWIVMLRHPVERAVSQYQMERSRGHDTWPLWPAMLLERWRLHGHENDFSVHSPLRHHAYRARGDYARQLDALYARFPPEQILLLQNDELALAPERTLEKVWEFLGLAVDVGHGGYGRVFEGGYRALRRDGLQFRLLSCLMAPALRSAKARYGLDWD